MPDSADLLYDRAMMAEKLDKLDLLEADLRKVITLKPEHAHAYNALGFTLADRTTRYDEALVLIRKAVELATDVVAIELLVMAEGIEYQRPLRSGPGVEALHAEVRARVPRLSSDRSPTADIAALVRLIRG